MVSIFRIQASNPRSLHVMDAQDGHIGDAMQTVFPMLTEDAYIVWNGIHVPVGYKYTVSFLIQDAVTVLERMLQNASGEIEIRWPSNDFAATWQMSWQNESLTIDAKWESVIGETEALLNARPTVVIEKGAFVSEWKQLLGVALSALIQAGYRDDQLIGLAKLRQVYEQISEPGVLYREPSAE